MRRCPAAGAKGWVARGAVLAVLVAVGTSCSRVAPPPEPPADAPPVERLLDARRALYPLRFRMTQRIVLTVRGKQYDFLGALAMRRGEGYRAVGVGEMGGSLFEFSSSGGDRQVLRKPPGMPDGPLSGGAMGDIEHLFAGDAPGAASYASRGADGRAILVETAPGGGWRAFVFDAAGERIESSWESDGRRVVRRAAYGGYRAFPGWDVPLPSRIVVDNTRWDYRLEIELLSFAPEAAPRAPAHGLEEESAP